MKEDDDEKVEELSLEDGVRCGAMMKGVVTGWLEEKGYGFLKVKGEVVFVPKAGVKGSTGVKWGARVWVKVVEDEKRGKGWWRAEELWGEKEWEKVLGQRETWRTVEASRKASRVAAKWRRGVPGVSER